MSKGEKIVLIIIGLIVIVPILLNEIKEYNLKELKKETLEISEILKNEYDEITQVNISKDEVVKAGVKTRGDGKAFVKGNSVTVILSYNCSAKVPGIEEVALSKSKCQNLELINNEIIKVGESDN